MCIEGALPIGAAAKATREPCEELSCAEAWPTVSCGSCHAAPSTATAAPASAPSTALAIPALCCWRDAPSSSR
eukprot:6209904-Pleurochrysis_carterae.AAC.2